MVEKMVKYSFLIYHNDYNSFLEAIRDLGVVHVIEKGCGTPNEENGLQQLLQTEEVVKRVKTQLNSHVESNELAPADINADIDEIIARYESLTEMTTKEHQQQAMLQKEIVRMGVWGDFEMGNIERLEKAGYKMEFFSCNSSAFDPEWVELYNAMVVANEGSVQFFITVTALDQKVELESADLIRMPKASLREMKSELAASSAREKEIAQEIRTLAKGSVKSLEATQLRLREEFDLLKVELNTEKQADNMLLILEGWVPQVKAQALNCYLRDKSVYYQVQDATEQDNAPVLLKNNAFTRLFEVIGELYDMPNYHEMDLTPFFAPFFVMFFGLCLGDAGYGLLITIGALIARTKVDKGMKPFMTLATILGIGTVVFGTLSGTLFGINMIEAPWPWLDGIKRFMMDSDQLFNFALIIGVCQIVFGMTLRAIGSTARFGFKNSLSNWGWLLMIVGCGATYGLQTAEMISADVAKIAYYVVGGIAALGIFILNDIKRNPLINIGSGLWDTYNMATGLLGDLLSYIRLFALGISGSVMGLVFNDLAVSLTADMPIIISQIVMVVILLAGHGMNIFMNGLGAFVHPMRLTFVEFYKNAGFEGGGKKYNPFARRGEQ